MRCRTSITRTSCTTAFPADSVTSLGAFHCGIDKVDGKGITSRGVLLDIVRLRGVRDLLRARRPDHARRTRRGGPNAGRRRSARGDIVLVRTGWWARFLETGDGAEPGAGLDWTCASWLHDHEVAAVAADNLMVENPVVRASTARSCRCTCCACATWA